MIRLSMIVWVMVLAVSAFGLYSVKFRVQTIRSQIAEIEQQLEMERESINVVVAEWAYLNRPDRLAKLAETYLQAKEMSVEQVADAQAIPFPQVLEAAAEPAHAESGVTNVSLNAAAQ